MSKILILAAVDLELAPLRESLKNLRPDLLPCCQAAGIGLAQAAANAMRFTLELKPERVLFIGSAGSFSTSLPLLTCVQAKSVELKSLALINGHSRLPGPAIKKYSAEKNFFLPQIEQVPMFSTLGISDNRDYAEQLYGAEQGLPCENLELFGVAAAAAEAGIPWNALAVITNYLKQDAGEAWQKNKLSAAQLTAEAVIDCLQTSKLQPS